MSAFTYTRLSCLLARRSFTFVVRLSTSWIWSLPKYTLPSRVIETSRASSLSASGICSGLLTGAMSTLMPFCNMGVTTMKMISRTSITSTMGVTLISELIFAPSFRFANAIARYLRTSAAGLFCSRGPNRLCAHAGKARRRKPPAPDKHLTANQTEPFLPSDVAALLQEVVDQFAGRVVHFDVERFHATGQIVEHHDGRDGDEQPDGRRNQRFRDTAGDRSQTGGLGVVDADEGVQNAHHRSEQPTEGSGGADGGETTQSALEFGVDDGFGAFQSALGGFNGFARDGARGILVSLELHQASGDNLGQVALLVALGNLDGFIDTAIAQSTRHGGGKGARLFAGGAIGHPAVDHHADRPTGHDEENDDDGSGDPAHCFPQAQWVGRDGAAALLDHPGGRDVNVTEKCCCYVSCEHELLFPPRNSLLYLDTLMRSVVPTAG